MNDEKKLSPVPCPRCGKNRWSTIHKGKQWMCRNCRYVRTKRT